MKAGKVKVEVVFRNRTATVANVLRWSVESESECKFTRTESENQKEGSECPRKPKGVAEPRGLEEEPGGKILQTQRSATNIGISKRGRTRYAFYLRVNPLSPKSEDRAF
jgi:hypothetical protein